MQRLKWIAITGMAVMSLACTGATEVANDCTQRDCSQAAIVTIAWRGRPDTMRVLVRGAVPLRAADQYVKTGTGASILSGRIVKGAGVDASVPFHYLPDSVSVVELAMELCDSALLRTSAAVDAYFKGSTGRVDAVSAPYCPWSARPVRIEPAP